MRDSIDARSMSTRTARGVLERLAAESPWGSRYQYIEAFAALYAPFSDEVERKTYVAGKSLHHIRWCGAATDNIEWFWNSMRFQAWPPSLEARATRVRDLSQRGL